MIMRSRWITTFRVVGVGLVYHRLVVGFVGRRAFVAAAVLHTQTSI
jgi:hypothetical protein